MTNIELKALRRLFFLDVADTATYIGKCSKRAWQYWESGSRKISDDVINIMNKLKEERTELLLLLQTDNLFSNLVYSRLIDSVKAELYSKGFIDKIIY
ncbi:DUF1870 family protein [uncultured Gilliamella sp.]|uniref:Aca2/YdiL-like domain-containing protein n=1 Tax=uncultured Gilliamella sp. TaxID=1193505 RepID=UPI0025D4FE47|nr:DUF1870 family protein [uncultured Gilliamella sp.]